MKVLLFYAHIHKPGGTEKALINLADILLDLNYDVSILSVCSGPDEKPFYTINSKVTILKNDFPLIPQNIFKKVIWYYKVIKELCRVVKLDKYDIVIGGGHNHNLLLPSLKIFNKVKIIGCEHIVYNSLPMFSRLPISLFYRFLDALVVLSATAKDKYYKYNSNIQIIPNCIMDYPEILKESRPKRIIMVGRLSAEKGYDRLPEIAHGVCKKNEDWVIDIFGSGDLKDELLELYKSKEVDKFINFKGTTKDINSEYVNSSVFLMISYFEAFPMVMLEAKAAGLPIISYNCPEGLSEIIKDGIDGFIIENGNVSEMCEKLNILIENGDLRIDFGKNARIDAQNYSFDNIESKWNDLLIKL